MAEQRDRADGDGVDVDEVDLERLRAVFVDAAPRTFDEVATAADVGPDVARTGLERLQEAGVVGRRAVSGVDITARKAAEEADVDVDDPITLYYLTAPAFADERSEPPEADDEIGRRVQRMTIPGASDLMRSWRRDALRAAYDHLLEVGGADPADIRDAVYPGHEAGFDDPGAWWRFVRPRLYRLPGVVVDDGEWFVEQRPVPRSR